MFAVLEVAELKGLQGEPIARPITSPSDAVSPSAKSRKPSDEEATRSGHLADAAREVLHQPLERLHLIGVAFRNVDTQGFVQRDGEIQ